MVFFVILLEFYSLPVLDFEKFENISEDWEEPVPRVSASTIRVFTLTIKEKF